MFLAIFCINAALTYDSLFVALNKPCFIIFKQFQNLSFYLSSMQFQQFLIHIYNIRSKQFIILLSVRIASCSSSLSTTQIPSTRDKHFQQFIILPFYSSLQFQQFIILYVLGTSSSSSSSSYFVTGSCSSLSYLVLGARRASSLSS